MVFAPCCALIQSGEALQILKHIGDFVGVDDGNLDSVSIAGVSFA